MCSTQVSVILLRDSTLFLPNSASALLAASIRRSNSRFSNRFVLSDFHSTFLALWSIIYTKFVQIFVGEHVFLQNESSAKRLASCISHFSVEYHNFYVQKCSVFVRSFRTPLSCPCSLDECTPIPVILEILTFRFLQFLATF